MKFSLVLSLAAALTLGAVSNSSASAPETPRHCEGTSWSGPLHDVDPLPSVSQIPAVTNKAVDKATADALDNAVAQLREKGGADAAVLLENGSVWQGSTGVEAGGFRFQGASLVKPFTAVVILQLVDEGRLSLGDSIDQWYPEVPNASEITIDHLLRMTSGLNVPPDGELAGEYRDTRRQIEAVKQEHVEFCPGEDWSYSNIGYLILGSIIEAVEEKSFADTVEARIVKPLELKNTYIPTPGQRDPHAAQGHQDGTASPPVDYASSGAAGALVTTASDLVAFWHGVMSAKIISPEMRDRMLGPVMPWMGSDRLGYARGVMAYLTPNGTMYGHSGSITGFHATLLYVPEIGAFIATMTNDRALSSDALAVAILQELQ